MASKEVVRKKYKQKMERLGVEKRAVLSKAITDLSTSFLSYHPEFHNIHLFLPIERLNEINTVLLLYWLFENQKKVYTSVVNLKSNDMETVILSPSEKFRLDSFGITVPENPVFVDENLIDLVFVPLLAVDHKGNRLGYGKGFYDKFLSRLKPEVFKVGLSFFQLEDLLPFESHDVVLDACIFPDKLTVFSNN